MPFDPIVIQLLDALSANIAVVAHDGRIIAANKAWKRFSRMNGGNANKTTIGSNYFSACSMAAQEGWLEAIEVQKALRRALGPDGAESEPLEYPCHSPLEKRWFSVTISPIKFGSHRCALVVHENVTIRHELSDRVERLTRQMTHSDRMAIIGEWSATIAHEIRNPLTAIQTRADLIKKLALASKFEPDRRVLECGEAILQIAQRINAIVDGILLLARPGKSVPFEKVPLIGLIRDALFFTEARIRDHHIQLHVTELSEDLSIECNGVQITEVFLNLISNAIDAVESISDPEQRWIRITAEERPLDVVLSIENGGAPIAADIQAHMLGKRMFSTKLGEGTIGHGFGLRISNRLLRESGGSIEVDSCAPHPRFVVILPKRKASEMRKGA